MADYSVEEGFSGREDGVEERFAPGTLVEKDRQETTRVTLKFDDAFFLADASGDVLASTREMGLFWRGKRFLSVCNLFLEGQPLVTFSHYVADRGDTCLVDLTNGAFTTVDGMEVRQGSIHVRRVVELRHEQLVQTLTITSYTALAVPLALGLKIGADFRDLFEVRGHVRQKRGTSKPPQMQGGLVTLGYQGIDEVARETRFEFTPQVDHFVDDSVFWKLQIASGRPVEIKVTIKLKSSDSQPGEITGTAKGQYLEQHPLPRVWTDDPLFNKLLDRGIYDLLMLSTLTPQGYFPYAGIPRFSCPFGRDGLITCLEFIPWYPAVARGTLAFLAAHQGTRFEEYTDEEPGKILHEYRTGEMANCREIPFIPYYGTIDATPLFLITLETYIRWSNDLPFLAQLWPHAEAAARWLTEHGDRDGDTFIEYHKASEHGLHNHGWRDAWDSVSHADGRLVVSPTALCEVQGYAFAAYRAMSYLAGRLDKMREARVWEEAAGVLQRNFLSRFWWEEEQAFYLALDSAKEPAEVVSSNAGQCLWTGIVPAEKAGKVRDRMMRDDMYSGWGIRTLSEHASRYNPMSYHNGSVWPHDVAMIGMGFARYNELGEGKAQAGVLLKSLYEASLYFEGARLPELYCGFARSEGYGPTRYPVACIPQAWTTGAPFMLLSALLGLQPDAERHCLALEQPLMPPWLNVVELRGIRVGEKSAHLRFVRNGDKIEVQCLEENEVDVHVI